MRLMVSTIAFMLLFHDRNFSQILAMPMDINNIRWGTCGRANRASKNPGLLLAIRDSKPMRVVIAIYALSLVFCHIAITIASRPGHHNQGVKSVVKYLQTIGVENLT